MVGSLQLRLNCLQLQLPSQQSARLFWPTSSLVVVVVVARLVARREAAAVAAASDDCGDGDYGDGADGLRSAVSGRS